MTWPWGSLSGECGRAGSAISRYTAALRDAGIFPYDLNFAKHQFRELLDGTDKMGPCAVGKCLRDRSSRSNCPCSQDRTESLDSELRAGVFAMRNMKNWFGCLDCIKSGQTSKTSGTCRIEHGHDDVLPGARELCNALISKVP
jgi:hypothetical protein